MNAERQQYSPEYLAEDNGKTLIAISVLFICLDTIFLGLRFYTRKLTRAPFGLDDFVIPFAWFTHIGLCILGITMVYDAGVGRHLVYNMEKDPRIIVSWAKSLYALEWLYLPSCALPKISVLLVYLRIFADRGARLASHAVIWVVIANWIAYLIACSLQCSPFEYQWNKNLPGGKCINVRLLYKLSSVANIATDLAALVLPIQTVVNLNVSTARKLGLFFIFLFGSVGIVAACIRMATFFQTEAFVDNTWASVKLVGWSIIEPGMYIVAACSLRLRPLFREVAERLHLKELYGSISRMASQRSGIQEEKHQIGSDPFFIELPQDSACST